MTISSLISFSRRVTGRRRVCNLFLLLFLLSSGTLYILIDKVIYSAIDNNNNVNNGDNIIPDDVMVVIKDLKNGGRQKEYIDKKGVHVIVGQYMGSNVNWNGSPNLSSGNN